MTDARPAKPPSPSPTARTAELLVEIAVATAGEADLDQILFATLDRLAELVPFTGGSIALIDGDDLVVKAAIGPFAEGALGTRLPRGRGRSWQVIETLEPSLVDDIAAGRADHPEQVRRRRHPFLAGCTPRSTRRGHRPARDRIPPRPTRSDPRTSP